MEGVSNKFIYLLFEIARLDVGIILLVILIVIAAIVLDLVSIFSYKTKKATGVQTTSIPVAIDGGKALPVKDYISTKQLLSGRPDAVIIEDGFYIPVEFKSLSKKIHDRHVIQLLVYMRLVEEFEGKKPPYGYLILGKKHRRVKIYNSDSKQAWLDKILLEMRAILKKQGTIVPAPEVHKCAKCDVANFCKFKIVRE